MAHFVAIIGMQIYCCRNGRSMWLYLVIQSRSAIRTGNHGATCWSQNAIQREANMDFLNWLADTGTNEWIKNFWSNNWLLITVVSAPIGAWLKDKHPDFWAKLATMLPFVGKPANKL
jgi:hypothetical protein